MDKSIAAIVALDGFLSRMDFVVRDFLKVSEGFEVLGVWNLVPNKVEDRRGLLVEAMVLGFLEDKGMGFFD